MRFTDDLVILFKRSPDLMCVAGTDGMLKIVNDAWTTTLGYSREDLLASPFLTFIHPDDHELVMAETMALGQNNERQTRNFRVRFIHKQGYTVPTAWSCSSEANHILAIGKNLTELVEKETFLLQVQDQARICGWSYDLNEDKLVCMDEVYRTLGQPRDQELALADLIRAFHRSDRGKVKSAIDKCAAMGIAFDEEFRVVSTADEENCIRLTGTSVKYQGKVHKIIGTFQNIDNTKSLAEHIQSTANQLTDILENSPGIVFQYCMLPDGFTYYPYVSPQICNLAGIAQDEWRTDPKLLFNMTHPDDRIELARKMQDSAQTLNLVTWDGRVVAKNGETKWVRCRARPHKREDGSIIWNGVLVDMTNEKQLEEDLSRQRQIAQHAARLASIGELSAGVGHEINNPLAIIMGLIDKMQRRMSKNALDESELRNILMQQQEACDRIKHIVDGLRTFAHAGDDESARVGNLKAAITDTMSLISEIYKKNEINITTEIPTGDLSAGLNNTHIQQILLNLLTNARDACIAKGKKPGNIAVTVSDLQEHWQLAVKDNGIGIPSDIQDRIFQSFFTTKEVGTGTGLGLAITKNIIETAGGSISYETGSTGTTFFVHIPKSKSPIKIAPPATPKSSQGDATNLRVLIIDDEEMIRDVLNEMLSEMGCEVTMSESALTALDLLNRERYDLIVTDLKMPGMDGLSFLAELDARQLAPATTKYIISGGINRELQHKLRDFRIGLVDGFIKKPFSQKDLNQMLLMATGQQRRLA